jgi:hypothetical protein
MFFSAKKLSENNFRKKSGGGGGIRTHGALSRTPVFKTGALNRSATPPHDFSMFQPASNGKGAAQEKISILAGTNFPWQQIRRRAGRVIGYG